MKDTEQCSAGSGWLSWASLGKANAWKSENLVRKVRIHRGLGYVEGQGVDHRPSEPRTQDSSLQLPEAPLADEKPLCPLTPNSLE